MGRFVQQSSAVFAAAVLLISACGAQRPFYASGNPYPGVLPQNTPAAPVDLELKFGGAETTPEPYKRFEKDPVYNVEKELVDRVKEYPRDKQPYWYVNAAHINSSRNQQPQQQSQSQTQQQQLQAQQSQVQQLQAQIQDLSEQLKRMQAADQPNNARQRQAPRN